MLSVVRQWIKTGNKPTSRSPDLQHSKGLMRYFQKFDRLTIEVQGNLLCYNEPIDDPADKNMRICLLLSLSISCLLPYGTWDITTTSAATWGLKKPSSMTRDSTTGQGCTTGSVPSHKTVLAANLTNPNNEETTKSHWKTAKPKLK